MLQATDTQSEIRPETGLRILRFAAFAMLGLAIVTMIVGIVAVKKPFAPLARSVITNYTSPEICGNNDTIRLSLIQKEAVVIVPPGKCSPWLLRPEKAREFWFEPDGAVYADLFHANGWVKPVFYEPGIEIETRGTKLTKARMLNKGSEVVTVIIRLLM
ncbi:hypothetical protein A3A20_02960 [Candidatus Wolfebacteria bacterium RIFCSPLOWO2_01_FULL_45_19]|uniref:Uncharacterized protein n=1 Tax=Candidatus Wolfebacteria bacterium RIFCSPLOWO2_01_FULL_45_19 TaxID=1802557 RepID=A0A1F8DSF3_9BACT|nr:MAG: hypothetical protein UX23_C0008G0041 [Parcubacteria group bacterium GW2011_GWB1_45_9]OGM90755.1 MAG: hypothetical protein A3A20_02960 [Candidatus Wolfebacteria bacterium RIFCSPLOWO2_01_FULL_45_19]